MTRRLLLVLLALAAAVPLWATAQAPEVLKFEGKTYSMHTNPLEPYLAEHAHALPQPTVRSSALWRGYIATWVVRDGKLFLEDVRMLTSDNHDRSVMKSLFPDGAPQVATWFTGNLIVPTGELVRYVHMGYGSTYSSYLIATVTKGEVGQVRRMNAAEFDAFRHAQFEAFKKTKEYRRDLDEAKKGDKDANDEFVEKFLFAFDSEVYLSRIFPPD